MKIFLAVLGVLAVTATARAETFRRAGSACITKATTYSWTSFGLGLKAGTGGVLAVCPLDAIGEDASNLTHVKVKFQVPAGGANPQCIYAASDYKGQAIFKYILSATVAADGLPVIDFGDTHVQPQAATTTATLQCSWASGQTLLYYTYDDQ